MDDNPRRGPGRALLARPVGRANAGATSAAQRSRRRGAFQSYRGRTLVDEAARSGTELLATHEVVPLSTRRSAISTASIAAFRAAQQVVVGSRSGSIRVCQTTVAMGLARQGALVLA